MVIALHGRAAVSDHPDSHFVALGGGGPYVGLFAHAYHERLARRNPRERRRH